METVQKVLAGFRLDLGPVQEPLGFIRVLEWVFSICAFATTCGYAGSSIFSVHCETGPSVMIVEFVYPFRLQNQSYFISDCHGNSSKTHLQGDYSSSAECFVCVGVFAFLYCTFTLVLCLGYQQLFREWNRGPVIDVIVTAIFAFLWLVSSSVWAKGLTDVKFATNPDNLIKNCSPDLCRTNMYPSMGSLNTSVLCGFINVILWAGNCWFIYKETPFYKPTNPPVTAEDGVSTS